MEDIIIKGNALQEIITESIPKILKEKFTATYSNPLAEAISEELKNNEGVIKTYIRELIAEIVTNEQFKKVCADQIIAEMIKKGLRG